MNLCSRCSGELPAFAVFCPHCAQAHEPNFDDLINLTIDGRYRVYRRLGQGGLSTIFAATDLETDSVVAIKISDPLQLVLREMNYAMDAAVARDYWDEMLERMRREAETLAAIDHPNIVRFSGTGMINDDLRYVVMEFLRGRTLRDEIDRNGPFEPSKAVRVAIEVASALIEAHSRGIVHRDINPRNIMIADGESQESFIKLIDFGIAKFPQPPGAPPFTQHSTLAGTVAYASPEQCASHPVDHRSDIYSLGVVLYEMVTGQRPFNGRTPTEIALKQIQSEPRPPRSIDSTIPIALEKTILRALAKNPIDRQQSVKELSEELRTSSNQIFIPLAGATPEAEDQYSPMNGIAPSADAGETGEEAESNLTLVRRRRRRLVVAATAALIAVIVSAALFGWPSDSPRSEAPDVSANVVMDAAAPDAAPAIGSDVDSLELAANESSRNNAAAPNATVPAAPDAARQALAANSAAANNRAPERNPTPPKPSPAPIPPRAQPQMPPAPSPEIALNRAPQPESEPDISQGPRREDGGGRRRENDSSTGDPNRSRSGETDRDPDRDRDYASNRRPDPDNETFNRGRAPNPPDRNRDWKDRDDDDDDDYDDDSGRIGRTGRIGPKLYQWSGRVNHAREIIIELPGVPGRVEIPRAYRHRVGLVEPPSANNDWRYAVLRVFGRGGVSIVIRWWPATRNTARLSAQR